MPCASLAKWTKQQKDPTAADYTARARETPPDYKVTAAETHADYTVPEHHKRTTP